MLDYLQAINNNDMVAAITGAATYLIKYWLFQESGLSKADFLAQIRQFITELFASDLIATPR